MTNPLEGTGPEIRSKLIDLAGSSDPGAMRDAALNAGYDGLIIHVGFDDEKWLVAMKPGSVKVVV